MWFVVGQGHFRESSRLELQPGAPGVSGEVPQLEEEGVVVGEEALFGEGSMCAAGQFPWTRRDDHLVPSVGVTGPGTFTYRGTGDVQLIIQQR